MNHKAYVLLSGGIDSSTCLGIACERFVTVDIECISIDYGQRHKRELEAAQLVSQHYHVNHRVIKIPPPPISMLTNPLAPIPDVSYDDLPDGISPTYVPFRNGLMLSTLASIVQGSLGEDEDAVIFFGAHSEDAARWAYPDCTPEFIGAMVNAIFIGTYQRVRLETPLQWMMKEDVISLGWKLNVPYNLTWSCYKGGERHCGTCPTCRSRRAGFHSAHVSDPTMYEGLS